MCAPRQAVYTLEMATLLADFSADLLVMARQHLAERWGPDHIADDRLLALFFDSLRRRPAVRPRRVWEADDFNCPSQLTRGWEVLRKKAVNGDEIRPHLSIGHSSLTNLDGLLNEWGVHHLHLGIEPYLRNPSYVDRTESLLFAMITDDDFYAVNIYPHGAWEATSIIESLHRNWPHVMSRYRIKGIQGEAVSEKERRTLRSLNTQAVTTVTDGTVYMAIGGGVASSGDSIEAQIRAARMLADVERVQATVKEQLATFIAHLRQRGYVDGQDVRAKLAGITPQEYQVLFVDYGVLANVRIE
jgi:hypothetical protein